jgi:hypothetical protein
LLCCAVLQGHALGFAILASVSSGVIPGVTGQ